MKYNKCLLVLSALAAVAFTGCKNEDVEKHRFDNKFYITSTILSDDLLIKSDTPGYTKTIESRLAKPAAQQVAVTIGADPSQVAAYNMIYGDNAVALPAEFYALSSKRIDIAAGQVSGDAIEIVFKDINTLDGSLRYVLPVTVTSCNGVDLLDSRSTVYFVARQGAMINVVANIAWMNFPVSWSADAKPLVSGMKQVTIEALLRSADWTDGRGDALSSVFGIEGNFLVRIGDADRPRDQLQLATGSANGGNWPAANAAPGLPVNEWVHIAVVWDAVNGERIYYQNGKQVAYSHHADQQLLLRQVVQRGALHPRRDFRAARLERGPYAGADRRQHVRCQPRKRGAGGLLEIQRGFRFDDHRPCERHESLCRGRHADLDSRNSS